MKSRNSFISNSSSTSFIIHNSNICQISSLMYDYMIRDFRSIGNEGHADFLSRYLPKLNRIYKQPDVISGENGIVFQSHNFDTYLLADKDRVIGITCTNHNWDECWPPNMNIDYYWDEDTCYDLMKDKYFYPINGDSDDLISTEIKEITGSEKYICKYCGESEEKKYGIVGKNGQFYCTQHFSKMEKV